MLPINSQMDRLSLDKLVAASAAPILWTSTRYIGILHDIPL
jgi:hypothetical protein